MRNFTILGVSAALVALTACGGGSGVSSSKQLGDLSEDEKSDLCDWMTTLEVDTSECATTTGTTATTLGQCTETLGLMGTCDLTVGQVEECYNALADDPCSAALPPECNEYFTCLLSVAFGTEWTTTGS